MIPGGTMKEQISLPADAQVASTRARRAPIPDDNWYGPMSEAGDCAVVPWASSLVASSTRFLIIFDARTPSVVERVEELGTVVHRYSELSVLELEADPSHVQGLVGQPGIVTVLPALGETASTHALALGFDSLMALSGKDDQPVAGHPYGGRQPGDSGGYPVLARRGDAWVVDFDADKDWATPAALVPAVSFSVGPRSAAYPCVANDLVNVATLRASAEMLVVAAAGNCGGLGNGTVSAWAQTPWVLTVGATSDEEGTTLAPFSSRGVPDDPDSGPDLVAFGRSVTVPPAEGTSFAAPRVAHLARMVTAAMSQLGREVRLAQGAEPHGVPLVGLGTIDVFDNQLAPFPVEPSPAQALPIIGVDATSVRAAVAEAEQAGLHVEVEVNPHFLREFLLDCAAPMPGYAAHEVGRGFIDGGRVRNRLAALTFRDIVGWFSAQRCDGDVGDRLSKHRVFVGEELDLLDQVLRSTGPHVRYDYRTQEVTVLPVSAAT